MQPFRIFIGLDPRQVASFTACQTSIWEKTNHPVAITPLVLDNLPIDRAGLTPFTYSRFLVPYLCGFEGVGLFMDADIIIRGDLTELFDMALQAIAKGDAPAVWVRNKPGFEFERAAVMLFNCGHEDNLVLTPDYVDDPQRCKTPHLIDWTDAVGHLGDEWGHLVGYEAPNPDAKLVHYTQGVPLFPEIGQCEHSEDWWRAFAISFIPMQITQAQVPGDAWKNLMGNSVHAARADDGSIVPKLALNKDAAD